MKTLLFTQDGPLLRFDGRLVHVEDINPHWETKWNLTRWEMVKLGARLIVAAIRKREG